MHAASTLLPDSIIMGDDSSSFGAFLFAFKAFYSCFLTIFAVVLIMALIFTSQTRVSSEVHPAAAFVVIWAAIIWLTMVEGGQASLVGLPPVDMDLYKDSHPKTYMTMKVINKGDNLDRYLIGRQFMVLVIVFVTSLCGAPLPGSQVLGMPEWVQSIFLTTGIGMILLTANLGQLHPQVNCCLRMLDYINNYFMVFTLHVCRAIEFSGLLHAVYLMQYICCSLAGKPVVSKEPPRSFGMNLFFWGRVFMSVLILAFAFAVTLGAIVQGKTTLWAGVPPAVGVVLFFIFMSIVGMLEGMQIAFFAVAKLTKEERGEHPMAKRVCKILFRGQGHNLHNFMVGRQVCVTLNFFIIARCTTLNVVVGTGNNLFGVSDSLQSFFNTGLLGALITTEVGSLFWQLIASVFPIGFLSNPVTYVLLRLCLWLEATGVCASAAVVAWIHRKIAGFQLDTVYIGTAEERAAAKQTTERDLNVEAGHLYPGVPNIPQNIMDDVDGLGDTEHSKDRA